VITRNRKRGSKRNLNSGSLLRNSFNGERKVRKKSKRRSSKFRKRLQKEEKLLTFQNIVRSLKE